ncbi:MAG TPA: glutamine--fructose-6-phosphate transaminase (isomerizing) [Rickettsiales bacterium]|nr:glutamine--fructose-6-phosphate transaminase (isomerizing) [Rickettsiales bacterium]
MCGIVGIISNEPVAVRLLQGLRQLEYRGYDSSGIATSSAQGLARIRAEGKLVNLEKAVHAKGLEGNTGVGHTRWATHGLPTEANAHPHATERVALVHNGIIENFRELKQELQNKGVVFSSQTDTEVVVHLIDQQLKAGKAPKEAVALTLKQLEGAFALGIVFASQPDLLIAARKGSPLAIGYGKDEMFMGSDATALAPYTSKIAYLEDGDMVVLTTKSAVFYDRDNKEVTRPVKTTSLTGAAVGKGEFRHFMLKEIYEQPTVIGETMSVFCDFTSGKIELAKMPFDLGKINKITLVACGTSYYAALVARYWLEDITRLPVEVDIASEYRYRNVATVPGTLAIFVSQSGETADTLAALRATKAAGQHSMAIVNAQESTMAHEADVVVPTYAGIEIGVASTKAFTTQLVTLACVAIAIGEARGAIKHEEAARLIHALAEVPSRIVEVLHNEERIAQVAAGISSARDILYIGRGGSHAIALEGALKLKEISYIHAEGYAAGELKHGPIALIDEHVPVIVIAPHDHLFEKTVSNAQEVAARGGKVIAISDAKGCKELADIASAVIEMPAVDAFAAPILYALPIQLLAYHVAVQKGTDVDQPRNLAKSVTVE